MRLNLGEIAQLLGLAPEQVLWEGAVEGLALGGGDNARAKKPASLWEIAHASTGVGFGVDRQERDMFGEQALDFASLPENVFAEAPWAGFSVTGGQVDSRLIRPGNLFFCLPGEKADGHEFARAAAEAGAVAVIARRNPFAGGHSPEWMAPPVLLVPDVKLALWRVAMCHRDTSLARVIGITGTAGKTSVKEVLAQVLEMRGRTERNPKNFNNQIGLPISMLNASADASFWVMEAGISEAHDMRELGAILRPDVGLILNVGEGHVQGLGDKGVAAYKAMLLDYIQPGGMAVVSADYPDLTGEVEIRREALKRKGITRIEFSGENRKADCSARYEGEVPGQHGQYAVRRDSGSFRVETPFRGEFGAENVAAITAVSMALGLSRSELSFGFSQATLPDQRFAITEYHDCTLVDDSYNANPLSARRMIRAAGGMARDRRQELILVMGEMLELGEVAAMAHKDLGRAMAEAGPVVVFWKGGHSAEVAEGLAESGYQGAFYPVAGGQEFALLLEEIDLKHTLTLFKGSRGNKLERLVDIMKDKLEAGGQDDAV